MKRVLPALQVALLCAGVALAQSSPSFRLEESTINAGGHPRGGVGLQSTSYRMSLDAVGETPVAPLLRSAGHSMDAGFARCFPPPGEVRQVAVLGDKTTFVWAPDRSVGTYRVYRGDVRGLPHDYGACRIADVDPEFVSLGDFPETGQTFFYLVTAENTLLEEGVAGHDSAGAARIHAVPCP